MLLLLAVPLIHVASAQTSPEKMRPRNILEALEQINPGEGFVTILQDPDLRGIIGSAPAPRTPGVLGRDGNYSILYGYRVQVFNSNLPNAKSEAYARAEAVRQVAPTLSSYITFRAPFWRLTVGNFATQEEARQARARLVTVLPAWGRESYEVREKVRILNYTAPHAPEE